MLHNYLKTALRSLWHEKSSALLNLSGLTLGIGASLILFLLVRYHNSFDTFHKNRDQIYRVVIKSNGNSGDDFQSGVPSVLPDAFRLDFSEAEEVTFTSYRHGGLVTIPQGNVEPKKYEEDRGVSYVQPNFFRIFDRKVLSGSIDKALDEPGEAVLATSWAIKYFGKEDALGAVVKFENREYKITAVIEDPPSNSDLPISLMLSYATVKKEIEDHGWNSIWSDEQCYFLLKEGAKVADIEARVPDFVKKHGDNDTRDERTLMMQPLSKIHFDDRFGNYNLNTVSRQMLMALNAISVFLLITACINFINLSTVEAIKRSKEVGIRKSLGSTRGQLIAQFLSETTLVTVTAAILALGLAHISLGFLNGFLDLNLVLEFSDPAIWGFVVGVVFLVATVSGLYPSFVVSSFSPILALKNNMGHRGSSGFNLRRGLVVLQFFISQFLVIATIVLIAQTNYFRNKDLGFRKDAIITVPVEPMASRADSSNSAKMKALRNEIMSLPGVESASLSNSPPSSGSVSGTAFTVEGSAGAGVLDLDTAQGFLVNEKLASLTGHANPADMLGKRIDMWGKNHTPIEATILLNRIRNYRTLSVSIHPANMQETIGEIKKKWEATYQELIFSYDFMDESIREFYESEQRTSVLMTIFTSLAIFIGCLGLFGLASFMANQKTKEIGVRKVLGASIENILMIFSREFIILISIGFAIAAPLAWVSMNRYLDEFAYKIELGPVIFLAGLSVTLLVAAATISYRSIRAAMVNPVESLRSE